MTSAAFISGGINPTAGRWWPWCDLPDDELRNISEAALAHVPASIHGGAATSSLPDPAIGDPDARLVVVPRPDAVQSEIRLGHFGVARDSPETTTRCSSSTWCWEDSFVSRINLNLREDKGYTYGARTVFDWRVGRGPFSFRSSVQTGATADAIRQVTRELDDIRASRPVTDDELALARAALTRGFPHSFETAAQVARAGTSLALHGLPLDEMSRFVDRVAAVDVDAVSRAARSHLHPDRLLAVVVGSKADVLPSLQGLGCSVPRRIGRLNPLHTSAVIVKSLVHRGRRCARLARRDEGSKPGVCDRRVTQPVRDAATAEC